MKKALVIILVTLLIISIVSFLLGYWKAGIIIGGVFTWLTVQVSEHYSVKNAEYLYGNRSEPKKNFKKYED
ncbi:hypothetical protein M5V91_05310 [Cytobacillus pseudoceanisediminis]|uniref:hypothetical protein n=1 Tax=Cytobacillus pseudoceanisediminis TaxID=3051614 RepID=UPI0021899874|nr:hypothetical protein [Cytobacillus pseudoceanisediminis]UQX55172.1 hypothetical protein M5V91_05310 [Cytobacillus pseudoceanisediminis]